MSTDSEESHAGSAFGRLSDGKTAAASEVSVRLGGSGLDIVEIGGGASRHWPYATLEAAEPLNSRASDALLTSPTDRGMTLYRGGRVVRPRANGSRTAPIHWGEPLAPRAAMDCDRRSPRDDGGRIFPPRISPPRAIASVLPNSVRGALGGQVLRAITGRHAVCRSTEGDRALNRLTARLSAAADGAKFKVVVVDWGLFNAFAVPGEQIMLTRGSSPKPGRRTRLRVCWRTRWDMASLAIRKQVSFALSDFRAFRPNHDGGLEQHACQNVGLALAQLAYTRNAERKADMTALRLLKEARVSQQGLASFFAHAQRTRRKVGAKSRSGGMLTNILAARSAGDSSCRKPAIPPHQASPTQTGRRFALFAGRGKGKGAAGSIKRAACGAISVARIGPELAGRAPVFRLKARLKLDSSLKPQRNATIEIGCCRHPGERKSLLT